MQPNWRNAENNIPVQHPQTPRRHSHGARNSPDNGFAGKANCLAIACRDCCDKLYSSNLSLPVFNKFVLIFCSNFLFFVNFVSMDQFIHRQHQRDNKRSQQQQMHGDEKRNGKLKIKYKKCSFIHSFGCSLKLKKKQ